MNVMPQFLEEEPEPLKEEIDEPDDEEDAIVEVVSDVMPEVIKEKPRSTMDDIYGGPPVMKVVQEEVKAEKQRKKRKPMTDDQKEKLALARGKALEVRRAKAKDKQELKDLQKMKKQKELNDLREEVGMKKKVVQEVHEEEESGGANFIYDEPLTEQQTKVKQEKYYTQADVDKATLNAIMGYETIRKERKAEKLIRTSKEREEKRVAETIRKVIQPRNITYGQEGYFDNCF
tara:strand:+ start:60 stop:755 length:696 start_codon:yes stop_codon:yes gene_type:complete